MNLEHEYTETDYKVIPIDSIVIESRQRQKLGNLDMLVYSISQYGQFLPIVVQDLGNGKYRLIDGERRLRACISIEQTGIKAILYENISEIEQKQIELELNVIREQLNPIDEARAIRDIFEAEKKRYMHNLPGRFGRGFTQKDLARKLDRSEAGISQALKVADAADTDPTLELCSTRREIHQRIKEGKYLPIAGGVANKIAEESMIVDSLTSYLNVIEKNSITLLILDIDLVCIEDIKLIYSRLQLGGALIIFHPIVKTAQVHATLNTAEFFYTEEPYIWHCSKEETYKSYTWAGKSRQKSLRYMGQHSTHPRNSNALHGKAKPYNLIYALVRSNTEGVANVVIAPCFDFDSVKACMDQKRNVVALFDNKTLRDKCLLNAEEGA